jgi:hypothetical protein
MQPGVSGGQNGILIWVWISNWEWCDHGEWGHWVDNGWWEDHGWYDFFTDVYSASLTASSNITPDGKSPTAEQVKNHEKRLWYQTTGSKQISHLRLQAAMKPVRKRRVSYFPEFSYETYWRFMTVL